MGHISNYKYCSHSIDVCLCINSHIVNAENVYRQNKLLGPCIEYKGMVFLTILPHGSLFIPINGNGIYITYGEDCY